MKCKNIILMLLVTSIASAQAGWSYLGRNTIWSFNIYDFGKELVNGTLTASQKTNTKIAASVAVGLVAVGAAYWAYSKYFTKPSTPRPAGPAQIRGLYVAKVVQQQAPAGGNTAVPSSSPQQPVLGDEPATPVMPSIVETVASDPEVQAGSGETAVPGSLAMQQGLNGSQQGVAGGGVGIAGQDPRTPVSASRAGIGDSQSGCTPERITGIGTSLLVSPQTPVWAARNCKYDSNAVAPLTWNKITWNKKLVSDKKFKLFLLENGLTESNISFYEFSAQSPFIMMLQKQSPLSSLIILNKKTREMHYLAAISPNLRVFYNVTGHLVVLNSDDKSSQLLSLSIYHFFDSAKDYRLIAKVNLSYDDTDFPLLGEISKIDILEEGDSKSLLIVRPDASHKIYNITNGSLK